MVARMIPLAALGAGLYLAFRSDEAGEGAEQPPRGIRNNNPGNIERTGTAWRGMASDQSADDRFLVFDEPVMGIRALARVLDTYRNSHGLDTVEGIISRWAPNVENNTNAYMQAVARAVGVDPYTQIPEDTDTQAKLVSAIIHHENGVNPYPAALIREGINRARA